MLSQNISGSMLSINETLGLEFASDGRTKEVLSPFTVETIVFTGLSILQCALLHPRFQGVTSARWIRLSLAPLTIGWWLCHPFRLPVQSYAERNAFTGFLSAMMVFKTIDWSFSTGPYHLRTLKHVDGVAVWEKEPAPKPKSENFDLGEFVWWILLLFTSQRGHRWSWGPAAKGNNDSFAKSLVEVIRLKVVSFATAAFLLASQDISNNRLNPTAALLKLGIRSFPGISILAECILSASFMFLISSCMEMVSLLPVLCTYLLHPLAKSLGTSSRLTDVLNPENYPLQFGSLLNLSSVSHFWGKSWHQKFRKPFLFCGGKPAMSLARLAGATKTVQKICGAFGVFAFSGLFHEYPLYAFQREPHPHPRVMFSSFPGCFLFFFVQSFGVILEPFIIPRIPKSMGGGRLWTLGFLLLTAPLFTHDVCRPGGMLKDLIPPSEWTWHHLLTPVPFAL